MAVKKKFSALGRGLDALISTEDVTTNGSDTINEINIELIEANPNQPRREFDEEALQELADSIQEIGIIQPITLRKLSNGKYQIVAGERRWRASMRAKLTTIPAYIISVDEEKLMEMALVENIQRQDLNPIEIALAYQQLIEQYGLTQEKLAEKVGKKRATVANFLRLLRLPAPVQMGLRNKVIDTGHARALLAVEDPKQQIKIYNDIAQKKLSVRAVEEYVKKVKDEQEGKETKKKKQIPELPDMTDIKQNADKLFGKNTIITCDANGKGKLTIPFSNIDEIRHIIEQLSVKA
ncbi:MAG: ParB/RepB/Spo0J family partition protein [Bacteroidaceae bacterium]|nr:ParB/RepB/Spo0J family partition protein [Bacteroidaceae bacterium]